MNSNDATFAVFRDRKAVQGAIESLRKLGFKTSAISLFQSQPGAYEDFSQVPSYQIKTSAIVGAGSGAIIVGAYFLFLAGTIDGSRVLLILAGVFAGALLGAAVGLLVGIGVPDSAGKRYGQYLHSGGILVSVHADNPQQVLQAMESLTSAGGEDIQLINEIKTWDKASLEQISLDRLDLN